jgi:hypothetical protein
MLTFLPSTKPASFSPWMRAASAPGNAPGAALPKTPITRRGSCARAASGHAAAAPHRNVMNSRRFMSRPLRSRRASYHMVVWNLLNPARRRACIEQVRECSCMSPSVAPARRSSSVARHNARSRAVVGRGASHRRYYRGCSAIRPLCVGDHRRGAIGIAYFYWRASDGRRWRHAPTAPRNCRTQRA